MKLYALLLVLLSGCAELLDLDDFGVQDTETIGARAASSTSATNGGSSTGGSEGGAGGTGGTIPACLSCAECLTVDPPCHSWWESTTEPRPCGWNDDSLMCASGSSCSLFVALQQGGMCSIVSGAGGAPVGCLPDCNATCVGQEPISASCISCLETQFMTNYDACSNN